MLAIYKREMKAYFTGVLGYVFLVIFLAVGGALFCYTTIFSMTADVTRFFLLMMIFSAIMLPLLTMKSFSEEKKQKTDALLLTSPVSIISIVTAKFLAAYTVFAGALIVNSLYFTLLYRYAQVKTMMLFGNVLALLLVGMVFISVGIFVSSLTENQLSAAVGTIAVIIAFLAVGFINVLLPSSFWLRYVFDCLSIFTRFQTFTSGYIDLASIIYYLSVSFVFLYLTVRVFDRRRYK